MYIIVAIEERILAIIPSENYQYNEGTGIVWEDQQIVIPRDRLNIAEVEAIPEGATPATHKLVDGAVVPIEEIES